MSRQTLYDNRSRLIGFINTDPSGRQTVYDAQNRYAGFYEPKQNRTFDAQSRIVGTGNLLASLIR